MFCGIPARIPPLRALDTPLVMRQVVERARRVLVVDDEEAIREVAEAVLRHVGYGVAVASDGPEALRIAEERGPFDLFVIDIVMPQMRGTELARRLRQIDANVKVLYLTGYPTLFFKDGNVLREDEAFVVKPVSLKGLLEAVSLMLFGHIHGPVPVGVPKQQQRDGYGRRDSPPSKVTASGILNCPSARVPATVAPKKLRRRVTRRSRG